MQSNPPGFLPVCSDLKIMNTSPALFETLLGHFRNGCSLADVSEHEKIILSIEDHLHRLFNARKRAMGHLPNYGLPDIPAIYDGLPYSLDHLATAIKDCLDRYETRLKQVQVKPQISTKDGVRLQADIAGQVNGDITLRFRVSFLNGGSTRVTALRGFSHA